MPRSSFIKCVAVGDGAVGKTCMLFSYATDKFPTEHIPTVFDTYAVTVTAGDEPFHLTLFDTAGQEEYDRLRLLTYPGTDVFLVCFSVVSPDSFQNIKEKWIPELKHHTLKNTRFILVGTKADLRFDASTLKTLRDNGQKPISPEQGRKLARQISAECYMECSAMTRQGVKNVFDEAIMSVLEPRKKARKLPSISKLFRMLRSR